jgi:hypothetical protein
MRYKALTLRQFNLPNPTNPNAQFCGRFQGAGLLLTNRDAGLFLHCQN